MQKENVFVSCIKNRHVNTVDDEYPFCIPVIRKIDHLIFDKSVTYIIGENGSGKSTILEALAVLLRLNPEGGSRNFNFSTANTHSKLYEDLLLVRSDLTYKDAYFFRAESYYNVASEIERLNAIDGGMYASYGGKSIHEWSHGEGIMALINNRLNGKGIYIFDEPEAALSFKNQLAFLCWMKDAVSKGSQIIITTHSPVILSYPDSCIYEINGDSIERKSYSSTKVFTDMYGFMLNRELIMHELGLE